MNQEEFDPNKHEGPTKTDMYCHNCNNNFIAELDYRINGNHVIECPHCYHEHCRVIEDGIVTGERFDSKSGGKIDVTRRRIWKSKDTVLQVQTSSAAQFIRQSWLNRGN